VPSPGALIAIACALHIVIYLVAAPEHVVDEAWPLHARFHVLQAIGWVVAANVALGAIGVFALRRGVRWAWWTLAIAWPFLHASYFAAAGVIPEGGAPALTAHIVVAVPAVLYAVGLVISLPMVRAPAGSER
jgi:hypothetical protein